MMKLGCVLTAAGGSKRFGEDKLMYPIDGKPMIEHSLIKMARLKFEYRVLVTQSSKQDIITLGESYGFDIVTNDDLHKGMSHSVVLGTQAIEKHSNCDGIMFCVSDQPRLRDSSLCALIAAFEQRPQSIVRLGCKGRCGNPSIFPKSTFLRLQQLSGDSGGSAIIDKNSDLVYICDVAEDYELADIDTKGDISYVRH